MLAVCCVQLVVGAILKSGSEIIDVDTTENQQRAAHNCWIGAAIYGGFFVLSLICYFVPIGSRKDPTDNRQRLMAIRQEE